MAPLSVIVADFLIIAGCLFFATIPLQRARVRASWAKCLFVIVGIFGVAVGTAMLVLDRRWFVPSEKSLWAIHGWVMASNGFVLGLISALLLSGQVRGTKQIRNQQTDVKAE